MREYRVIKILLTRTLPVKMNELIAEAGLSERTVRNVLQSLNRMGEKNGFQIRMIRNQGYRLEIKDQERFETYRQNLWLNREAVDLDNRTSRQRYLLHYLLQNNRFESMERLAEEMGISRSTLIADLKEVERQLIPFHLTLNRRAHYGMKIEGEEKNFRKAFSCFVLQAKEEVWQTRDFEAFKRGFDAGKLKAQLLKVLKEKELKISDLFLNNIVTHLFILLYRVTKCNFIVSGQDIHQAVKPLYRDIADQIAEWIELNYQIFLPEDEIDYLALHIAGKTIVEHIEDETKTRLRHELSQILQRLDGEFMTRFSQDQELREALLLHMFPLLNRLYYNLQLDNPLVEDVYSQYANVFVIAFRLAEIIEEEYGFKMSRDEAGYVALHFATHLERMKQQNLERLKRIAVICATGGGSAQLIRLKLEAAFPGASIITGSITELEDLQKQPVDLILTAIPLTRENKESQVVHIPNLLDDQEIQEIKELIAIKVSSSQPSYKMMDFKGLFEKELFHQDGPEDYMQLLEERSREMVAKNYATDDFSEQVLAREKKFTTIYKNGVAGPHPMRMCAVKDCISVTILKKPISYEGKPVQLIFLINLLPGQLFLHKEISKLLLLLMERDEYRKRLLAVTNYEQFVNEVENLL